MDQSIIQKQLKKMTFIVIAAGILFFLCGGLITQYLNRSLLETANARIETGAREYKQNLLRKIDDDMQILYTLASFMEFSLPIDSESFADGLYKSNNNNDFITMSYFSKGGTGIRATINEGVEENLTLDSISPDMRKIVEKAFEGESSVSKIYEYKGEKYFLYGVPVYDGDDIAGALTASHKAEVFTAILDNSSVFRGRGYIHLVGTDGEFLIESQRKMIPDGETNIYDGSYISQEEQTKIQQAISRQESVFSSFRYDGHEYQIFLEPVGLNNWYLLCVNTLQGLSGTTYQIVWVAQITFFCILLLAAFLILYGYRLLRRNNKELIRAAYHDPVTGADNMAYFSMKLNNLLQEQSGGCVAALNIRQFKFINEIFGKEQADQLLCYIKRTLESHLDEKEFFCRDSADMFYLYLTTASKNLIQLRLETIMNEISGASIYSNSNYRLLMYCGVVILENDHSTADTVMTHSLFALEASKGSYQNNVWFYNTQVHIQEELENYIETHMHQALRDKEFRLYLQPKINLKTGLLGGAEALVRWITLEGKTIYPDQFIPLFEQNGFCSKLDLYMAEQVCIYLRQWMDQGYAPVPISVNQSKLLFYEKDYVETLSKMVDKYQIPASLITLEILEGLAMENVEELNKKIELLQAKGFRISMDDFGSGYSSLNILGNLSIDELKLDRGFLQKVSAAERHRPKVIMEQIVQLTKKLGISTVAEGVETKEDEQLIKNLGCDFGQGYYYSKPISAGDFFSTFVSCHSKEIL